MTSTNLDSDFAKELADEAEATREHRGGAGRMMGREGRPPGKATTQEMFEQILEAEREQVRADTIAEVARAVRNRPPEPRLVTNGPNLQTADLHGVVSSLQELVKEQRRANDLIEKMLMIQQRTLDEEAERRETEAEIAEYNR